MSMLYLMNIIPKRREMCLFFYDDVGSPREVSPRSEEMVSNKTQEGPLSQHNILPRNGEHQGMGSLYGQHH